jgi:hypothetical protein
MEGQAVTARELVVGAFAEVVRHPVASPVVVPRDAAAIAGA